MGEVESNGARQVADGKRASGKDNKHAQQHVVAAMAAEQVGDWGNLVGGEAVGVGSLAQAGALDGGGLEGFVAKNALVDDVVAVAEGIGFVRGGW